MKLPLDNDNDPEELRYQFSFREVNQATDPSKELWYEVGTVLHFLDPVYAMEAIEPLIVAYDEEKKRNARRLVGQLHTRIKTYNFINFYEEKTHSAGAYDRVLEIFVRTNSGGMTLEYSDLLLSTAVAKWDKLDARKEIFDFTDALNGIGAGYNFGKDFVLKGALYLTPPLPIQYMVRNFTKTNLLRIEANWEIIQTYLRATVRLVSKFGFYSNNIVSQVALLPIALYLMKRGNPNFDNSSDRDDVDQQVAIRQWLVRALLRGAFGTSSDRMLKSVQDKIAESVIGPNSSFPSAPLNQILNVNHPVSDDECAKYLSYGYGGKYTRLVLSVFYPGRDWKAAIYHEDHIFPKSEFELRKLRLRNFDDDRIDRFVSKFNQVPNLELLTDNENLEKSATPFGQWLPTRDDSFKTRHDIPSNLPSLEFDAFEDFFTARSAMLKAKLKAALGG